MNISLNIFFALTFICTMMVSSCKKYENDEALIHLSSPEKRMVNKWKLQQALQGELDITDTINQITPNNWIDYKFNKTYYAYVKNDSLLSYGTWNFLDYDKNLARYPNSGGVIENAVKRLDRKALWIKTYVPDLYDSVEYHFEPMD